MKKQLMIVENERFLLNDPRTYQIRGQIPEDCVRIDAYLSGKKLPVSLSERAPRGAMEWFKDSEGITGKKVEVMVSLPELLPEKGSLTLYASDGKSRRRWFSISVDALSQKRKKPQFFIEEEHLLKDRDTLVLRGWAASDSRVSVRIFDSEKNLLPVTIQRNSRLDVADMFRECEIDPECAFYAEIDHVKGDYLYLVMRDEKGSQTVYPVAAGKKEILQAKIKKYEKKSLDYLRTNGVRALALKSAEKLNQVRNRPMDYEKWLPCHLPGAEELKRQRRQSFSYAPKISIVVPLYRTRKEYLEAMIESVKAQSYENWELCLSDGSGEEHSLKGILSEYRKADERIRVMENREQLRISENTNQAVRAATGEFIAFLDHDDALCPNALYECVKALNQKPGTELLYSDEDKMSVKGTRFFEPHFKPDFNPDLLRTVNYICHLLVVRKSLLDETGLLRPEFDGAQDYDLILRLTEKTDKIHHIPKILYHWRSHEESTAENPESKKYAFLAGQRALDEHFKRIGVPARVIQGPYPGLYRTVYEWPEKPLVSIIIPNKDHIKDLSRCIASVEEKSLYRNYEFIIVENNSMEEETFAWYKELEKENPKVRVLTWDGPFNYSAINNFGARYARGEYLLLLNNDTEVISPEWLDELLGYAMRPDVGIVGARLYYGDNTVQHAGVVIGFGGIAGHCFVQQPRESTGYCHRIICAQNYSAVTAACMMVRAAVFREVEGLSEDLAVAFNDLDFCLKVRKAGYLVVYDPYAELYHYESKSRGLEDTPEKVERFAREIATVEEHWPNIYKIPDPYYNPNLTLKSQDFSLKRI